ncbi:MAG: hypothetical protein M9962_08485 [Oligoflexia bacterium]|nr:hypothetical protein [Oligoflexia bacterium]
MLLWNVTILFVFFFSAQADENTFLLERKPSLTYSCGAQASRFDTYIKSNECQIDGYSSGVNFYKNHYDICRVLVQYKNELESYRIKIENLKKLYRENSEKILEDEKVENQIHFDALKKRISSRIELARQGISNAKDIDKKYGHPFHNGIHPCNTTLRKWRAVSNECYERLFKGPVDKCRSSIEFWMLQLKNLITLRDEMISEEAKIIDNL